MLFGQLNRCLSKRKNTFIRRWCVTLCRRHARLTKCWIRLRSTFSNPLNINYPVTPRMISHSLLLKLDGCRSYENCDLILLVQFRIMYAPGTYFLSLRPSALLETGQSYHNGLLRERSLVRSGSKWQQVSITRSKPSTSYGVASSSFRLSFYIRQPCTEVSWF